MFITSCIRLKFRSVNLWDLYLRTCFVKFIPRTSVVKPFLPRKEKPLFYVPYLVSFASIIHLTVGDDGAVLALLGQNYR